MTIQINPAFPVFTDRSGLPLHLGAIYIGPAGQNPESNPAQAYFDEAMTAQAVQPIRTQFGYPVNGNSPARLFVNSTTYSMTVRDRSGALVYSALSVGTEMSAQTIGQLLNPATSAEISAAATIVNYLLPNHETCGFVNPLRYATNTVPLTTDMQAAVNKAIQVAYRADSQVRILGGPYRLSQKLYLPINDASEYRGNCVRVIGDGTGEIFARSDQDGTTLVFDAGVQAVNFDEVLGSGTSSGNYHLEHMRFEVNTAGALYGMDLESFYCQSRLTHLSMFQAGTGGGVRITLANTSQIESCYFINYLFLDEDPATVRTGIGVYISDQIPTGLPSIYKTSSRGWDVCYKWGDGVSRIYKAAMVQCECSVANIGVQISALMEGLTVRDCYFEGMIDKAIEDAGDFTIIDSNTLLLGPALQIDGLFDTQGNRYNNNYIETAASCTLIRVKSTGTFGGPIRSVTNNTLLFSTSGGVITNVVGLQMVGEDPGLYLHGNCFNPRGPWIGGAGTSKIVDQSTGIGIYGLIVADSGNYNFPWLSQGFVTWGQPASALGDANFAAGVLTVPVGNRHVLTLTAPQNITSIVMKKGQSVRIRCTNTNATFVNGAALVLNGAVNIAGAIGTFCFYRDANNGNVYEDVGRRTY